jgi:hypothetical protein
MDQVYQIQSEDIASGSPGYITPLEVHCSPNRTFFLLFMDFCAF